MLERISELLLQLNNGIYEKESEISLSLLAAIAGESVILLGPPGVAKSMIGRRLTSAFHNARSFEYLMSRFSTPDEIFGPVSISKLKDEDKYERATDGYLPCADVVFLDEIWKAGPAIQNTLLTVINEKIFKNGEKTERLPLKLLIAASNELPAQGEGLEALWDRFLLRLECKNIQDARNFNKMILDNFEPMSINEDILITPSEYCQWEQEINLVDIPEDTLIAIGTIRRGLKYVELSNEDNEGRPVYVSDRRWKKIAHLLKTIAFVHDRKEVIISDLMPICHCLWQEPDERDGVRKLVVETIFSNFTKQLSDISAALKKDIRIARVNRAASLARNQELFFDDTDKKIFNEFYFHIHDHGMGQTYVFSVDYMNLPKYSYSGRGTEGILYEDKKKNGVQYIRALSGEERVGSKVMLFRDEDHIFINGVRYDIEKLRRGEFQSIVSSTAKTSGKDYYSEIEQLVANIETKRQQLESNLFVSKEDMEIVNEHIKQITKAIVNIRQDLGKL